MFNLFNKKSSPEDIVDILRPRYAQVVSLVNTINGQFPKPYEAGIFVATVATSKILTFQKVDPPAYADKFNVMWVNYLIGSYSIDGISPSKSAVLSRLQDNFPIYRKLFFDAVDPSLKDEAQNTSLVLMCNLFSNCTGKKPEEIDFLKLMFASSELIGIGLDILKDVHE